MLLNLKLLQNSKKCLRTIHTQLFHYFKMNSLKKYTGSDELPGKSAGNKSQRSTRKEESP